MTDQRFHEAVELYGDMVFRLAYSYLKNRADAEDVMQESLLKLYVEPREFESPDHEKHWLLRVAANECKKLLRSPWRRRTAPLEDLYTCQDPEESAVCEALDHLDPKYRAVVHLHYYEGYPVKEIAALLGANTSTVQTWLMRARGQLQTKLKEAEAYD